MGNSLASWSQWNTWKDRKGSKKVGNKERQACREIDCRWTKERWGKRRKDRGGSERRS